MTTHGGTGRQGAKASRPAKSFLRSATPRLASFGRRRPCPRRRRAARGRATSAAPAGHGPSPHSVLSAPPASDGTSRRLCRAKFRSRGGIDAEAARPLPRPDCAEDECGPEPLQRRKRLTQPDPAEGDRCNGAHHSEHRHGPGLQSRDAAQPCVTAPRARGIFGAAAGASSGADMCPASVAAVYMPRARMVFAGRVQIRAACSRALRCALVFPLPSHDRCAIPLLALLRSDALATVTAYAAAAGAL